MTDDDDSRAAEAFEVLGAEVAALRPMLEFLVERAGDQPPDHVKTLNGLAHGIASLMHEVVRLGGTPALKLTPETLATQITAAGTTVRRGDHDTLIRAVGDLNGATRDVRGIVASALNAKQQRRSQLWWGLTGLVAGILLWSMLPGFVVRNIAPASWHWPERMATRTLGADNMWNGARRLGSAASPANWETMVEGAIIVQDNREAVDECRQAMGKAARTTKCTLTLSRLNAPAARGDGN